ncbi:MAG: response regulator [Beijerinckiaceae bacterium]|nr:response regulator [Beijerinckiaceae bacterium]
MALNACRPDAATRLVIIEDEAELLGLMKEYFTAAGYRVKGFTSAEDFIADLDWIAPVDCVIADVRLPGMDGLQLLKAAHDHIKSVPLVFMSGHGDIPMAVKAIKEGAFDFIEKPFMPERLEEIVSAALAPGRMHGAPSAETTPAESAFARLTPRQREIVELVAQGLTSKEIAARLGMSFRTVDTHRARITEKLQVGSLAELLRLRLSVEVSSG